MRYRVILAASVCALTIGAAASARTVAVVPGAYELVLEQAASAESAQIVEDAVAQAVNATGFDAVRGDDVVSAVSAASPDGGPACASRACIERVRAHLKVDEAIAFAVKETGPRREAWLFFATGPSAHGEWTGPMSKMLEGLKELVARTLKENPPRPLPAKTPRGAQGDQSSSRPADPFLEPHRDRPGRGFYVTLALTTLVGASAVGTDIAVRKQFKDLEQESPEDRSAASWKSARNLQIADRVLIGATLVGAVATAAMALLPKARAKKKLVLAPTGFPGGGGVLIDGRFP